MADPDSSGGHHDFWVDTRVYRQGNYGNHVTMKGKIVYQRERRRWTEKDLARVAKTVASTIPSETTEEESWTILDFFLQTMQHIINGVKVLAGFDRSGNFGSWLSFFDEVLNWLKDNKTWQQTWQPRWEKAIAAFWQQMRS